MSMLIRSHLPMNRAPRNLKAPNPSREKPSFAETALKSSLIGASVGTVVGETVGKSAFIGSVGYLGYRLGEGLGGSPITGALGAAVGTGAAWLLEKKVPFGGTLGAAGGFLTGGLIGGITGSVIGGVQAIAHSEFFKKS